MSGDSKAQELIIVGLNHKTAPLYIREKLALEDERQRALATQLNVAPRNGVVLLSTCNRVEIYYSVSRSVAQALGLDQSGNPKSDRKKITI